jgi:hypothetical protein
MGTREDIRNFPRNWRRLRERERRVLTRGERIFAWSFSLLPAPLVFVAVILMLHGVSKAIGIPMILVALVMMAVPVTPILGARVRRREAVRNDDRAKAQER